jgi:hypothetical protein
MDTTCIWLKAHLYTIDISLHNLFDFAQGQALTHSCSNTIKFAIAEYYQPKASKS